MPVVLGEPVPPWGTNGEDRSAGTPDRGPGHQLADVGVAQGAAWRHRRSSALNAPGASGCTGGRRRAAARARSSGWRRGARTSAAPQSSRVGTASAKAGQYRPGSGGPYLQQTSYTTPRSLSDAANDPTKLIQHATRPCLRHQADAGTARHRSVGPSVLGDGS